MWRGDGSYHQVAVGGRGGSRYWRSATDGWVARLERRSPPYRALPPAARPVAEQRVSEPPAREVRSRGPRCPPVPPVIDPSRERPAQTRWAPAWNRGP